MAHGSWFMVRGSWVMVYGSWLVALGSWLLAPGSWLITPGSWLLALGSFMARGPWPRKERDLGTEPGPTRSFLPRMRHGPWAMSQKAWMSYDPLAMSHMP